MLSVMRAAQRTSSSRRYDWHDFIALPDDDRRELVDGELVEIEVPNNWHEALVAILMFHLHGWARTRRRRVLASGYKVRIRSDRGAMPDVQVSKESAYRGANPQGLDDGHPQLAIEILSPSSRYHNRVRKAEWYASIGVPEYWIVDVDARSLERFVLRCGAHALKEQVVGDEDFRPTSMKGLVIPLAPIWDAITPRKKKSLASAKKPVARSRRSASRK